MLIERSRSIIVEDQEPEKLSLKPDPKRLTGGCNVILQARNHFPLLSGALPISVPPSKLGINVPTIGDLDLYQAPVGIYRVTTVLAMPVRESCAPVELFHELPPPDRVVRRERNFSFLSRNRCHAGFDCRQVINRRVLKELAVNDEELPFASSLLVPLPIRPRDFCARRTLPEQVSKVSG